MAAIEEAISVGRLADVAVQCSHHKAAGKRNWGKVHASLELIDRARSQGLPVAADVYPYIAMWTDLATILPEFANRYRIGAEKALSVLSSSTHFRQAGSFEFQLESCIVAAKLTPAQLPPE